MTLLLQGQDLAKSRKRVSWGYLAAKTTLKAYFPSLPHHKMFPYVRGSSSRFYRVLQKAQGLQAHPLRGKRPFTRGGPQPIPLAHCHRIHGLSRKLWAPPVTPEAAVGVVPYTPYTHIS